MCVGDVLDWPGSQDVRRLVPGRISLDEMAASHESSCRWLDVACVEALVDMHQGKAVSAKAAEQ